jgi:hypothetical protein
MPVTTLLAAETMSLVPVPWYLASSGQQVTESMHWAGLVGGELRPSSSAVRMLEEGQSSCLRGSRLVSLSNPIKRGVCIIPDRCAFYQMH